jgi:hypothetical protein
MSDETQIEAPSMTGCTVRAAVNELEQRLLDAVHAQQAAVLADAMAEATALLELAEDARRTQAKYPTAPIATILAPLRGALSLPNEVPKPTRTRKRKPSVASVTRQLRRAGVEIAGCKINNDGSTTVLSGKPVDTSHTDIDETTASPIDRSEWN